MTLGALLGGISAAFFLLVGALVALSLSLGSDKPHRRAMEKVGGTDGVDFFGEGLPNELPSALLDALPASLKVRRCYSGWRGGERVASFNFARGWGRQEYWTTAVAVERVHPERPLNPSMGKVKGQSGNWVLVVCGGWPGGVLRPARIVELWDSLKTVFGEEGEALQRTKRVPGGVVIRPRHEA